MSLFSDNFESDESTNRHLPSDHEIEHVVADPESIAYGLYGILTSYENHYNNLQNKYKGLAITWVLATFIAIGYLISGYESQMPLNVLLLIFFLSLISSMGVFLIWFLDAGVYDKLIKSIWSELYNLEEKFPNLGKAHHVALKLLNMDDSKPSKFHGFFYSYFIIFLLIIASSSISLYLYFINKWLIAIIIPIAITLIILVFYTLKTSLFNNNKS